MQKSTLLSEITEETQHLKYFYVLCAIYIAGMMTSLTLSARLMPLHIPLLNTTILLSGGTWTIPLSFFIQDITTEVYGYAKSRQLVQITVLVLFSYILFIKTTTYLPIPNVKNIDSAYNAVFNALPQHFLALIAAMFTGNLVNDYLLSNLKKYFKGKYLAFRFIASTMIGEAVLQLVGTTVAWTGNLDFVSQILPFVAFSYCYKLAFEIALTPANIGICHWLKKAEGVDVYDTNISYNPFIFRSKNK